MKKTLFAVSIFAALVMSACTPETRNEILGIPEGAILLSTENFTDPYTKTSVDGVYVVWDGDETIDFYVGSEGSKQSRDVVVSGDDAYITTALTGTGDIRGYYPVGIVSENPTTNSPVVVYPSVYSCSVSSGRQVIELPMVGLAESNATSIKFKHLTAAINVKLKNSLGSALNVDSVIVEADKYAMWLNGKMLTLTADNLSVAPRSGSAAEKKVKVLFPSAFSVPASSEDKCIQVPIAPIGKDNDSLTIKVYCHSASANYVYSYKDKTSTAIARNEVLTAKVDLNLSGHMSVIGDEETVIYLDTVTKTPLTLMNGYVLTGTYSNSNNIQVKIDADATVKLRNVNSTGSKSIRLEAQGDATIIVQGKNIINCNSTGYPALRVAPTYTLTITDDLTNAVEDSLIVSSSSDLTAPIGSASSFACGNIIINGGTIIATNTSASSNGAPGIGSGYKGYNCGDITINGGIVIAQGGYKAAGIGTGSRNNTVCGDININGGTVVATGGTNAAGIGTGGYYGAGNTCGDIYISSSVVSVTATKGASAINSIGRGNNNTCGTVTIGFTKYWEDGEYKNGGDDASTGLPHSPYVYEP